MSNKDPLHLVIKNDDTYVLENFTATVTKIQ